MEAIISLWISHYVNNRIPESSVGHFCRVKILNRNLENSAWTFQLWRGADNMVPTVACWILTTQRTNSDSISSRKQSRAVKCQFSIYNEETFLRGEFVRHSTYGAIEVSAVSLSIRIEVRLHGSFLASRLKMSETTTSSFVVVGKTLTPS